MHLEIEMVDAMSARFCSQFILSLFGGLQHGKFRIEERWSSKPKNRKKKHLAPRKTTKKPKKLFGNRTGEMWIIFLYFSFSHPHHHHPLHHHPPLPLRHLLPLHQYHPDLPRLPPHPLLPHPPCLEPSNTEEDLARCHL